MSRRRLYRLIADELDSVSEEVTQAGERLSEDGDVLARHARVLQGFDQWTQIQRGLAALLRAEDIDRAILRCTPGELAARLAEQRNGPAAT